ncbi:MAG: HPr family phosphocarrier protein [Candidatus Bathyarchaeia archaeon]
MPSATVVLRNKVGLHARPAALFVQTAKQFKCLIRVKKDYLDADAKSILDVLSLGAEQGSAITIFTDGEDAETALRSLVNLINTNFGEQEGNS